MINQNPSNIFRILMTISNLKNPLSMSNKQRVHLLLSLTNILATHITENFMLDKLIDYEKKVTEATWCSLLVFTQLICPVFHLKLSYWLDKKFCVSSNHWNTLRDTAIVTPTIYQLLSWFVTCGCHAHKHKEET